ncbi:MAG TPA: hypothetical protein VIW03_18935 [Anaeromyxobacter sp.]
MSKALALTAALLPLVACAPRAVIPDSERERVHHQLAGEQRWLRAASYAAPLWGDHTRVLLADQPLSELELVLSAGGDPIPPPPAERILAPGTPARVLDVEFPTGWTIARRVVMTPRYHPWALVEVPGDSRPHVVVLSQTAVSFEDVRAELDRVLTKDDPTSLFAALPEEQRAAVMKKELVEGMGPRAVEMAWGLPEKKKIDRPAATEEWTWPAGKRRAFLQEERLVRWEK